MLPCAVVDASAFSRYVSGGSSAHCVVGASSSRYPSLGAGGVLGAWCCSVASDLATPGSLLAFVVHAPHRVELHLKPDLAAFTKRLLQEFVAFESFAPLIK